MQFGLDAKHSSEFDEAFLYPSPVSNPHRRIEAKQYRARDGGDNGWFRHDNVPVPSYQTTPTGSCGSDPDQQHSRLCDQCGALVSSCITNSSARSTPKTSRYTDLQQNRDRVLGYGHPTEWYCQNTTPETVESPRSCRRDVASRKVKEFHSSCKEWFRHEHTIIVDDEDRENNGGEHCKKVAKIFSPSWWPCDAGRNSEELTSPRPRLHGSDAEMYRMRGITGSAKEWYMHGSLSAVCTNSEAPTVACVASDSKPADDNMMHFLCCKCQMLPAISSDNVEFQQLSSNNGCRRALEEKFLIMK